MKSRKIFLTFLFMGFMAFAQAPQGFFYQAVVRNSSNAIVANTTVGMRISILQGSVVGTAVYVETQSWSTNANGLVTLIIGGGTVVSGSIASIDWTAGPYFIKTETDPTGGSSYTITGTAQMLSVPYALYAAKSGSAGSAGSNTQITYNNAGVASGSANLTWDNLTSTHTVVGNSVTLNEKITSLAGTGNRPVVTDANGNLFAGTAMINGGGFSNYISKWTGAGASTTLGNSLIQDNGTGLAINAAPLIQSQLYIYRQQLTANGDGQFSLYGYRTRDTQNDGTGYGVGNTNTATTGYNFWGDINTFGVGGYSFNDYTRTGGVLGAEQAGSYWGSLGYKSSASITYGVYGSNAYANGAGKMANNLTQGVGGGFFGMIGSISRGNVVGQINSGDMFSSYNSGNVYTLGKNVELVGGIDDAKTPVYTVTSTESIIYSKGKTQLINGEAHVSFDKNYVSLLGEEPEVTVTPKGNCNGVYIASVDKNGFIIKELNNGTSSVAISWISVGNRIDNKIDEATKMVTSADFEKNIKGVLFNDGDNLKDSGKGMWWDGSKFQFGTMPESLSKVVRPKEDMKK